VGTLQHGISLHTATTQHNLHNSYCNNIITSGQSNLTKRASSAIVFTRWRQCTTPSNTGFLGSTRVHITNGISIGSVVLNTFLQSSRQWPCTLQRAVSLLSKLSLTWEDLDHHLTHGSLDSPKIHIPNGITVGSTVFVRLAIITDRQTDSRHYSVCSYRLHLANAAMQPNSSKTITPTLITHRIIILMGHHIMAIIQMNLR